MTEMRQQDDVNDRYSRWVDMWQAGVRASSAAMGLAELATAQFLQLSPSAAELLGTTMDDGRGLSYLAVVDPPSMAEDSFRLARAGVIEGTRARRRLRRSDGSAVDVQATGWAIRSPLGTDLGLWMASPVDATDPASVSSDVVIPWFPSSPPGGVASDRVVVDDRWRVTSVRSERGSVLGDWLEDLGGASLIELTHPDDLPALLFGLARATTDPTARSLVRLRHGRGGWRLIEAVPTIAEGHGASAVAFGMSDADRHARGQSISEAPGHLRRIADQIEAAAALTPLADAVDALELATTTALSPRQWEIVSRLVRGERVPTIAAALYLSPSTVRNQLSAVFAKVGVHSQEELIALYRGQKRRSRV